MNNELNSLKKVIAELNEKIAIIEWKKENIFIKIKNILENNIEEKTNNLKTEILLELDIYEKNKEELLNLNLEMFSNKIKYNDILLSIFFIATNKYKIDNSNPFFANNDNNDKVKTILQNLEYLRNDIDKKKKEIVDYEEENNEENISNLIKQKKQKVEK